jgi:hypothetical protein
LKSIGAPALENRKEDKSKPLMPGGSIDEGVLIAATYFRGIKYMLQISDLQSIQEEMNNECKTFEQA